MKHSPDTISSLADTFERTALVRPMRVTRYEPGTELAYDITGVAVARPAQMRVRVEGFVGGGFAGQVYRVKLLSLDSPQGDIPNLTVGGCYAIKILIPPSRGARAFRDLIYRVGFQSPFSLQVNPAAARSGALWQTLIRRAARMRFGDERAVTEIHATFVDHTLGSCGEISEWIDGRTWRLEVDDRLGARRQWKPGQPHDDLGSPEYLTKREFMAGIVKLLHDMGAPELARQYEWWTCKSQPNCLKRTDSEGDPETGLTAVDFRAGLALLPVLPMSPGDVPLIFKGLTRGSIVQFDRGNLTKLRRFVDDRREHFADMEDVLAELVAAEEVYRNSMPDITHNHVRLLYSRRLWGTMLDSAVEGWHIRRITDEPTTARLRGSRVLTILFGLVSSAPAASALAGVVMLLTCLFRWKWSWATGGTGAGLLVVGPMVGRFVRSVLGRGDLRRHYGRLLTSWDYLKRAVHGHIVERLITWHHQGRVDSAHAEAIAANPWLYALHGPLAVLPPGLHRFVSDRRFFTDALKYIFLRPIKLYFNTEYREQWLREMLAEGKSKHLITDEDAAEIESQIDEPFIQKYLKSLAVHVCTLPITQVVSVMVAIIYVLRHPELSWGEAWASAGLIIGAFQIIPISPGSLVRGLYVLYLVARERDFKNYNIAVFLAFFKYIGYLAFPIQMAYHYPTLARFMAAHWSTGAVHIVPVFGEKGALLEHAMFDAFYNYPLTLRRRFPIRAERRSKLAPRFSHVAPITLAGVAAFALLHLLALQNSMELPTMWSYWYAVALVPLLAGRLVARWAGGATSRRRIIAGALCGVAMGVLSGAYHCTIMCAAEAHAGVALTTGPVARFVTSTVGSRVFLFALFSTIGAVVAELFFGEPKPLPADQAA